MRRRTVWGVSAVGLGRANDRAGAAARGRRPRGGAAARGGAAGDAAPGGRRPRPRHGGRRRRRPLHRPVPSRPLSLLSIREGPGGRLWHQSYGYSGKILAGRRLSRHYLILPFWPHFVPYPTRPQFDFQMRIRRYFRTESRKKLLMRHQNTKYLQTVCPITIGVFFLINSQRGNPSAQDFRRRLIPPFGTKISHASQFSNLPPSYRRSPIANTSSST